jgi:hypothetical protein
MYDLSLSLSLSLSLIHGFSFLRFFTYNSGLGSKDNRVKTLNMNMARFFAFLKDKKGSRSFVYEKRREG